MTNRYSTSYEPQWQMTEKGWHGVVALCSKGYQWTAYIEYADTPHWRIWAGCMFPTIQEAREWCQAEIQYQMRTNGADTRQPEPDAWGWLWKKLSDTLGDTEAASIRTELARRMQSDDALLQTRYVGQHA